MTQLDLFGDIARAEQCITCGTPRPENYPRALFLEPVSAECLDCNHATLAEIMRASRERDQTALSVAWARHCPKGTRR